jgi:hypothetical protein
MNKGVRASLEIGSSRTGQTGAIQLANKHAFVSQLPISDGAPP